MAEPVALPQHVLDTRYLQELSDRILPPELRVRPKDEEVGATVRKLAYDIEDAATSRWCHCDPDMRLDWGFDEDSNEDSDEEDGWFCSYRSIEEKYKMHAVLEQARLAVEAVPTAFPEAIHKEIVERCNLEHTKILEAQARKHAQSDEEIQASPPPSPPHPCVFPPFSFQKLPPEILVQIAFLVQAPDPHAHITLSLVDTWLRAFINSTPLLWSQVDFLYPLHMVHRYLERSAGVPLIVTALLPLHTTPPLHRALQDVKEDENNRFKKFLHALRPHRHLIRSLRLRYDHLMFEVEGENEGLTPTRDFLWDGSMVGLELLDLELGLWTWDDIKPFPSSYAVKELHLHRSWTNHYLSLFSSSLRSLVITDEPAPLSKIFDALEAAPRLISLTFRDMLVTGIADKKSVLVPGIADKRILGSAAEALLNCIVAPNLTSIALQLVDTLHSTKDLKDISQLQLFPVPRPSVRQLDLIAWDGGVSVLESVFRTFPGLTHLRIASSNLLDQGLVAMAISFPGTSEGSFLIGCPNLKHLTIDNELTAITEKIRVMVQVRHNLGSPLESLTLRGIPVDQDVLEDYMELDKFVSKIEIAGFDPEVDVYGDSDDGSISETSSEGDWASGDEEIVRAFRKVRGAI